MKEKILNHISVGMRAAVMLTVVIMAMLACPLSMSAQQSPETRTEGDWQYSVTSGVATLLKYTGTASNVTTPTTLGGYPVKNIYQYCFVRNTYLTQMTVSEGVLDIGKGAFDNCKLVSISLPTSLVSLGEEAFRGCKSLTSIELPYGLTEIKDMTFYVCTSLQSVTLPHSVRVIGPNAFNGCSALESITIPSSVTLIDDGAFVNISEVWYQGTKEQWNKVKVSSNAFNNSATIHWQCTATFAANGHGTAPAAQTVYSGNSITAPTATPSAQGYQFDGWYTDAACTSAYDFSTTLSDNITLYAKWTPLPNTITFNLGGKGTTINAQTVYSGHTVKEPDVQFVGNEGIEGWYTDEGKTQRYDFSTPVDHGFTLYAKWAAAGSAVITCTEGGTATLTDENGRTYSDGKMMPGIYTLTVTPESGYSYTGSYTLTDRSSSESESPRPISGSTERSYQLNLTAKDVVITVEFSTKHIVTINVTNDGYASGYSYTLTDNQHTAVDYTEGGILAHVNDGTDMFWSDSFNLTLTINKGDAHGCEGTITNNGVKSNITNDQTTYTFTPNGSIDIELFFNNLSGSCGDGLNWKLSKSAGSNDYDVLTISGSGEMENYAIYYMDENPNSYNDIPWYFYRNTIKTIVIEEGVTSIGDYAFYKCKSLTSVGIPSSVTSIGKSAFYGCSSLTSVSIPVSVASIDNDAFNGCSAMESLTFAAGSELKKIGNFAFFKLTNLTSDITIPASVTSIGKDAFQDVSKNTSAGIHISAAEGSQLTAIDEKAFHYANASIDLSNCTQLKAISKKLAFNSITGDVTLPSSVTNIEKSVFGSDNSKPYPGEHVYVVVPDGKALSVKINKVAEPVVITPTNGKADIIDCLFADPTNRIESRALNLALVDAGNPSTTTHTVATDGYCEVFYYDWLTPVVVSAAEEGQELAIRLKDGAQPAKGKYFTGGFKLNDKKLGKNEGGYPISEFTMPAKNVWIDAVQAKQKTITFAMGTTVPQKMPSRAVLQFNGDERVNYIGIGDNYNDYDLNVDAGLETPVADVRLRYVGDECYIERLEGADATGKFSYDYSGPEDAYGTISFDFSLDIVSIQSLENPRQLKVDDQVTIDQTGEAPQKVNYEYTYYINGVLVNASVTAKLLSSFEGKAIYTVTENKASKLTFGSVDWKDDGALMDHSQTLDNIDFSGADVDCTNLHFTGIQSLGAGRKMTLVADFGDEVGTISGTEYTVGTTLEGKGKASLAGCDLVFTIETVTAQEQTHNTVMGAMVSNGAFSIGNCFVGVTSEGLLLSSNTGADGVSTFANMGGGSMRQETGARAMTRGAKVVRPFFSITYSGARIMCKAAEVELQAEEETQGRTRGTAEQDITIESGKTYDILTDEDLILTLKLSEGDILITSLILKYPDPNDLNLDGKVNVADIVKAVAEGKSQAEIEAIVKKIMED